MKPTIRMLAGAVFVVAMTLFIPISASAKTQKAGKQLGGLYNTRYCEIFAVFPPAPTDFQIDIYNTVGLNRCPAAEWDAVNFKTVAEETGALTSVPNGPRRWVIDAISGASADQPTVLSGLEVRKVATLETPSLAPAPFTELTVNRTTEWNYRKGRTLRQVISPEGTRYAMQAYTPFNTGLTEPKLNRIDENPAMALPEGWRFKTRKLNRKLILRSVGSTRIVRDGLGCVYQRFKWPARKPATKPGHRK